MNQPSVYVGIDGAKKNCIIDQNGDNMFAAIRFFFFNEKTDKKKTGLLKNIDEKCSEAARALGLLFGTGNHEDEI